jgi:ribosomal protein L37AE/L43A
MERSPESGFVAAATRPPCPQCQKTDWQIGALRWRCGACGYLDGPDIVAGLRTTLRPAEDDE